MSNVISLESLGIPWKGNFTMWKSIPRNIIPRCSIRGNVSDCSGEFLYRLEPYRALGQGSFGKVDAFYQKNSKGENSRIVALKRPINPQVDLFYEALFQWKLQRDLIPYGISFSVPEVYSILRYQQTNDVWFLMEAYEPMLLSSWCVKTIPSQGDKVFKLLILQIALILEVFQDVLHIDHRDLKVNNIIIVEKPVKISIQWKNTDKVIDFPFRVVFLDFGLACTKKISKSDGVPEINPCPKEGRDIFHIIVSLWRISILRSYLEPSWGSWIRERLECIVPYFPCLKFIETRQDIEWIYTMTDNKSFRAPLCAPREIIKDCLRNLDGI